VRMRAGELRELGHRLLRPNAGLALRDLCAATALVRAVGTQQLLFYTDLYKQAEPGFFAAISYARFRLHCVPRAAQIQVRQTNVARPRSLLVARFGATWAEATSRFGLETIVLAAERWVRIPTSRIWLSNTLPSCVAPDAHVPRPVPARLHIREPLGDIGAIQNADPVCGAGELSCCPLDGSISNNSRSAPGDAATRDCEQEETNSPLASGPKTH
jgi:hypothetical protein